VRKKVGEWESMLGIMGACAYVLCMYALGLPGVGVVEVESAVDGEGVGRWHGRRERELQIGERERERIASRT
jgi:hypothetical protein